MIQLQDRSYDTFRWRTIQEFPSDISWNPYLLRRRHDLLEVGHSGLLLYYLWELSHLIREVNRKTSHQSTNPSVYLQIFSLRYWLPMMMYLDLLGSCGFLSLGDRCSKELGLDSCLELSGSVGHLLLLLLGRLGSLHCHLLGANLGEIAQLYLLQEHGSLYLYNQWIFPLNLYNWTTRRDKRLCICCVCCFEMLTVCVSFQPMILRWGPFWLSKSRIKSTGAKVGFGTNYLRRWCLQNQLLVLNHSSNIRLALWDIETVVLFSHSILSIASC